MKTYLLPTKERTIIEDYVEGEEESDKHIKRIIRLWEDCKKEILDDIQLLSRAANYLKYENQAQVNGLYNTEIATKDDSQ